MKEKLTKSEYLGLTRDPRFQKLHRLWSERLDRFVAKMAKATFLSEENPQKAMVKASELKGRIQELKNVLRPDFHEEENNE